MQSRKDSQPLTNPNTFNTICHLAIRQDHAGLTEFLKSGVCIGEFRGAINPIMQLARDGQVDAVYFLIRHFYGNKNHAVEGAAQGRQYALTLQLLAEGAMTRYAVRGAGASGDEAFTYQLINEYGGSPICAAGGAGYGGHNELCFKIIGNKEMPVILYENSTCGAIAGAALGGHFELLQSLLLLTNEMHRHLYNTACMLAIEHAAQGGFQQHLETINMPYQYGIPPALLSIRGNARGRGVCQNHHDINNEYIALEYEIQGLASGGHYQQTLSCLTDINGSFLDSTQYDELYMKTLCAASGGGHQDLMMALLEMVPQFSKSAMMGAIENGQLDLVNWLTRKYSKDIPQNLLNGARHNFYGGYTPTISALRFIAFIDHAETRNSLVVNSDMEMTEIDRQIQKQATRLNTIMKQYNFNLRQAQATSQIELSMFFLQVIPHIQPLLGYKIPRDTVVKLGCYIANMPQKEMSCFYEIFLAVVVLNLQKKHPNSNSNYVGFFRGTVTAVDKSANNGINLGDEPSRKKLKGSAV